MDFNNLPKKEKIYYQDDAVVIYCADCREILPLLPDKSVDLVLTSPPYDDLREYGGYSWNFEVIGRMLRDNLADGGVIVWIVGDRVINGSESCSSFKQALYFRELGLNLHDTMIYGKDGFRFPEGVRYNQQFEYMFIFSRGKPKTFNPIQVQNKYNYVINKYMTERQSDGSLIGKRYSSGDDKKPLGNIWFYDVGYMKSSKDDYVFEHPAIFPEALANDHIISWSNQNDLILDPFLGSGTTAYCAKKLGRKCIGIEINSDYCRIAVERLQQMVLPLEIEQVQQGQGISEPSMFPTMTLPAKGNKIRGKVGLGNISEETDRE